MILSQTRPRLAFDSPEAPTLALGRCHEIAGPGRRSMAGLMAGRMAGPVLWLRATRDAARLNPEGLHALFDPGRLVTLRGLRPMEGLWAAEEALRTGAAPCVVLETETPPALTPVRRLNLAAMAGGEAAPAPPLCLILLPEGGAAGAVETRWWVDPIPTRATPRWRLSLLRDKAGPPGCWTADLAEREARFSSEGV
jgi:protein ImuA